MSDKNRAKYNIVVAQHNLEIASGVVVECGQASNPLEYELSAKWLGNACVIDADGVAHWYGCKAEGD